MKFFRRKELLPYWGNEQAMMAQYRKVWESDPLLRRYYRDIWALMMTDISAGPVVELGGGSGCVRDYYPEVITSDYIFTPWTSLLCDASCLPFADESVGSYMAAAFFHHCVNPHRFFTEVLRTLRPGGRCVIFDPYWSLLAPLIYRYGTDEAADPSAPPFESESRLSERPLFDANVARATIVFEKHRAVYEEAFPQLRIHSIEHVNFFRSIAGGSFLQKSPFPQWCYSCAHILDQVLYPVRRYTAITMKVVLEKA